MTSHYYDLISNPDYFIRNQFKYLSVYKFLGMHTTILKSSSDLKLMTKGSLLQPQVALLAWRRRRKWRPKTTTTQDLLMQTTTLPPPSHTGSVWCWSAMRRKEASKRGRWNSRYRSSWWSIWSVHPGMSPWRRRNSDTDSPNRWASFLLTRCIKPHCRLLPERYVQKATVPSSMTTR